MIYILQWSPLFFSRPEILLWWVPLLSHHLQWMSSENIFNRFQRANSSEKNSEQSRLMCELWWKSKTHSSSHIIWSKFTQMRRNHVTFDTYHIEGSFSQLPLLRFAYARTLTKADEWSSRLVLIFRLHLSTSLSWGHTDVLLLLFFLEAFVITFICGLRPSFLSLSHVVSNRSLDDEFSHVSFYITLNV